MVNENPRFIGKSFDNEPQEGGDEYRERSRAEQAYMDAGVGAYDPKKRFSTIKTEAIEERKKAMMQLDPEGYKAQQKEKLKNAGKVGLGFLPVAGTITYWDEMSPIEKGISITFDAVDVLTFMKGGSVGAVYRGAAGIADTVSDTAAVKNLKNQVKDVSQDLAEDLDEVVKAQDDLVVAIAKKEDKGLNETTKANLDAAENQFKNKYDKYQDKVIEAGDNSNSIFKVPDKADFTSADEIITNIKRTTEGVADQSDAIINAKNKLDNVISTDVYQIEKAVENLEKATSIEKQIAKSRLKKINDDLKFLQESDFPYDDVKQLIDDKKRIIQKIQELENVDARSLQKASLALSRADTPTQELAESLNRIKRKEAESLDSMKKLDLGADEFDSFGGAITTKIDAPPKAPPGSSVPKIKPKSTIKPVIGAGTLTVLGRGEEVEGGDEYPLPAVEPEETPPNVPSPEKKSGDPDEIEPEISPIINPVEAPIESPLEPPGTSPVVEPVETPIESPSDLPATLPAAENIDSPTTISDISSPAVGIYGQAYNQAVNQFAPQNFNPRPRNTINDARVTDSQSKRITGRPRNKSTEFKMPDGKKMPPGVFPEIIRFESGIVNQRVNLLTGERTFVKRKNPSTKDSENTFEVLTTTTKMPKSRTLSQGLMNIFVTEKGIDIKRKRGGKL